MENDKLDLSDAYVRDHLLIQFMMGYLNPEEIEVAYKDWIEWLKKMEESHANK